MDKPSTDENALADSDIHDWDNDNEPTREHPGSVARFAAFQQGELDATLGYPSEADMIADAYREAYTAGYTMGKVGGTKL